MEEEFDFLEEETPADRRLPALSPNLKWPLLVVTSLVIPICLITAAFLVLERRIADNTERVVVALLETRSGQLNSEEATAMAIEATVTAITAVFPPTPTVTYTAETIVIPESGGGTGLRPSSPSLALNTPVPYEVVEGGMKDIDLRGDASDNSAAVWTIIGSPLQGTLTRIDNGYYRYRSLVGYTGTDSFTYRLCINQNCGQNVVTIFISGQGGQLPSPAQPPPPAQPTPVSDAPVADDDVITIGEDDGPQNITGQLLQGDSDAEDSILRIVEVEAANLARVNFSAETGTLFYDPGDFYQYLALGETATDIFSYTIEDNSGDRDTASVTIQIQGQNDAPVANNDPGAVSQSVLTVDEGSVSADLTGSLLSNDNDPDTTHQSQLRIHTFTNDGQGGSVSGASGSLRYDTEGAYESLHDNQSLTDIFTYTVIDPAGMVSNEASAQITIRGISDPPTMTISNPASPVIFSPTVSTTTSIAIAAAVSIIDVDSTSFQKLIVRFYGREDGQEEYVQLTFQGNQFITAFNYVVVQIQPNTLSSFRTAVQSAVYVNTQAQPKPGCRRIDFQLADESDKLSNVESVFIQVGNSSCPEQGQTAVPQFPPFTNQVYHGRIRLGREVR